MEDFSAYVATIEQMEHRNRMEEVVKWVSATFPMLKLEIKWNTPMFTHHGTFIIGIDKAKKHMSFAPEEKTMNQFADEIDKAGYSRTKGLFRIRWNDPVDYDLLKKIIDFNIQDKAECTTFWRK